MATLIRGVRQCQTQFAHPHSRPPVEPATPMPKNIQSIERAAAILRLLSGRTRRLGVVDLAGELGLPKGTVHGLLRTLQHVGFVEQDEETGKNELRTRALNWSDSLAARTNESVRIGTLHEGQVLIVHHVFRPDDSLQTLDVGALLPAHASALGKILLAHHQYAAAELARSGLESFTPATITDPEALERELERVRKRGWAADIGELVNGEGSCAAPIPDRRGGTGGGG